MLPRAKQAEPDRAAARGDAEQRARAAHQAGDDRGAMTILARAFGPDVFRYCRTMLGDDADAEDLMQITFLHAQRGLAAVLAQPSIRAWLLGIARHRCLDKIRVDRRRPRADAEALASIAAADADAPAALADRQAGRAIEDCLDVLEPRARAAVVMRFQDQLSYEEIAGATGEKAVTLRVRVSRALPALRRCLEAKGVEL
jgi:RNA polymerase sigma-70 factor (ECF subfamily)